MSTTGDLYMCVGVIKGNSKNFSALMKCARSWTMEDILNKVVIENNLVMQDVLENYPEVFIGCKKDSSNFNICNMTKIQLSSVLGEILEFNPAFGYIAYKYECKRTMFSDLNPNSQKKGRKINAFARMMVATNDRVHLPLKKKIAGLERIN